MSHWTYTRPFLGFDLETTDLDPTCARPVSGATVQQPPEGPTPKSLHVLIHPGMDALPIPEATIAIHGITTRAASERGMPLPEALEELNQALLEGASFGVPVVAANARYDLTILDHNSRRNGVPTLHERARAEGVRVCVIDPLLIDRWWDRDRPGRRRMRDLCPLYGVVNTKPHDALMDAVAAAELARMVVRAALEDVSEDPWRSARSEELRGCSSPIEMHALQSEWHAKSVEDFQARKRRRNPGFTDSVEWPVLAFTR